MKTIVVFGDSNSYGTPGMPDPDFWGRFAPHERWPGVMMAGLGDGVRLVEEALPGRTTVHDDPIEGVHKCGLRALPIVLESHRPIDLMIIALGTNDLKARFAVTASDIANSVGVLVRTVQASVAGPGRTAPKILVVSPPAIVETGFLGGMFAGGAEKSKALGAAMAAMAKRFGVAVLDAAPLIAVDPLDGIHLKPEAHAVLGTAVAAAIKPMM